MGGKFLHRVILLGLAGVLVTGCRADRGVEADGESRLQLTVNQIDFADSTGLDTKATESKFQNGDAIGVFVHTTGSVAASGNHSSNMKYMTLDAGAKWSASSSLSDMLTVGGTYYSTAYYPYRQGISNPLSVPHSVETDQSISAGDKATNLEASDFMIAPPAGVTVKSITEANVSLSFKHVLTKLVVSVGVPTQIDNAKLVSVKSVRIKGLNVSCNVNLATGVVTPAVGGEVKDITPRLSSGAAAPGAISSWEAIVVPQDVAPSTTMVEFICSMDNGVDKSLTYTTSSSLKLTSGVKTTLTLSSSADLAFVSTVSFVDGSARSDNELQIKASATTPWNLTSSASWLTLSNATRGSYASSISGIGTGNPQSVYVKVESNENPLAVPREATLTLANNTGGSMIYRVFQNYTSFTPPTTAWNITAAGGQSKALEAFASNQVWTATPSDVTGAMGLKLSTSATIGTDVLTAPYEGIGALDANSLFMQVPAANNTDAAKTSKVVLEIKNSNPRKYAELIVTQAAPALALDKTEQSVSANATSATFNVISTSNQMGVKYTASVTGATSIAPDTEQTVGVTTNYSGTVTVTFPINSDKTVKKSIVATVKYGAGTLTHTITQAASGPETVVIAGTKWTSANLTGNYGTNTGHSVEGSPEGYGAFFKWGSSFVYQRASSSSDGGGWGAVTTGAATSPSATNTSSLGYDYAQGLSGGTNPGDPCVKLNSGTLKYQTPTRAQWQALVAAGKSSWTTYNGIYGYFFGAKASTCNNTTIQDGCIFLPASGLRHYNNGSQSSQGSGGYYWSSSVNNSNSGRYCIFGNGNVNPDSYDSRSYGLSVRCVQE